MIPARLQETLGCFLSPRTQARLAGEQYTRHRLAALVRSGVLAALVPEQGMFTSLSTWLEVQEQHFAARFPGLSVSLLAETAQLDLTNEDFTVISVSPLIQSAEGVAPHLSGFLLGRLSEVFRDVWPVFGPLEARVVGEYLYGDWDQLHEELLNHEDLPEGVRAELDQAVSNERLKALAHQLGVTTPDDVEGLIGLHLTRGLKEEAARAAILTSGHPLLERLFLLLDQAASLNASIPPCPEYASDDGWLSLPAMILRVSDEDAAGERLDPVCELFDDFCNANGYDDGGRSVYTVPLNDPLITRAYLRSAPRLLALGREVQTLLSTWEKQEAVFTRPDLNPGTPSHLLAG